MFVAAYNGAHIWGGAERGVSLILAGLRGRGHRVLLFCNDADVARRAEEIGVPTEMAPLGGDIAVHDAIRFARTLRRDAPDVLLVGMFKKVWLCALAARLARVPRVVVRIGLETDVPRNLKYRLVLSHWVDAIVLKADDVRERYRAALPGLPEDRLVTVHGAVRPPPTRAAPGGLRAEIGIPVHAPVIGSVGRLARQKRFDRLIGALARLPGDVHGVLAGDGEERAELEALAAEAGVASRLHFLGNRDDIGDVLGAIDLFVVSSDREMLSFAMLEALAAGVPVVSTPVSGATEALEADAGGIPPGEIVDFSEDALAGALERLIGDPDRRAAMGRAAAARARERFDFDTMIDRWEAVLAGGGAP